MIFEQARSSLEKVRGVSNLRCSEPLTTKQVGGQADQADFLNACFRFDFVSSAQDLFQHLVDIESTLGRIRNERWGRRKIDLDLLLFGDQIIHQSIPAIRVPHPRLGFRRFVLEPAIDIAGDMVVPNSRLTIAQLLNRLGTVPRNICFARSSQEKFRSEAIVVEKICREFEWSFSEFVGDSFGPVEDANHVRLMVYMGNDEQEFLRNANQFSGATLPLFDQSPEGIELEVRAAIEAMERL